MSHNQEVDPRAVFLFAHQRYILYFDFLGFSEIVKRKFLHQVVDVFQNASESARQVIANYRKIATSTGIIEPVHGYFWFSDTLRIYSKDNSSKNLVPLAALAAYLTAAFLDNGFPTRSVINIGDFYVGKSVDGQGIFLGNALVDAYEFEKSQNWCGGVLHPSIWAEDSGFSEQIRELESDGILIDFQPPLKTGKILSHKCFCWPKFYKENFKKDRLNVRKDMVRRTGSQFPWEVECKIQYTESFYDFAAVNLKKK